VSRLLAALAAALVVGCTTDLIGPTAAKSRVALYEQVWSDLDRHYSLFDVKGINWDSLRALHEAEAERAIDDTSLANAIGALLAELRDVHVNLYTPRRIYRYTGYDDRPANFDTSVVQERYLTGRRVARHGRLEYGYLAPDVGYVWVPGFEGAGFGADLDDAILGLGGVHALVIDVRNNGGGNNQNGLEIAARFVDHERTYAFARYRNGPHHADFGPQWPLAVAPAMAVFAGPVVVLTNRRSYSAAEDFTLAMRVAPRATVVGDSTGGALGNPLVHELPNGWTYRFPEWIESAPDGTVFEEIGIAPDVWVRGSPAELQAGRDAMLDTALAVVRRFTAAGSRPDH
jgi:Peptidase family S41/Tricorn protease C1 domain